MYEDFFYERIVSLRMKKGISAREMSLDLGQSPNYINNIENQRALPSMTVFFYICEYLKMSPRDFFDDKTSNPAKLNEIIDDLKLLEDKQLENLAAVIKDIIRK